MKTSAIHMLKIQGLLLGSILTIFIAVSPLTAAAETNTDDLDEYVEWVGANSGVNWSSGQVTAEGAGVGPANKPPAVARLLACRAAVVDAQRNLLESYRGVRVNSSTVVSDMMLQKDIIRTTAEGLVKGATIVSRKHEADGSCSITMIAPVDGKLTKAIYNETQRENVANLSSAELFWLKLVSGTLDAVVPLAQASAQAAPWQTAFDSLNRRLDQLEALLGQSPKLAKLKNTSATGIVIDARGSNFIPSMSPKIRRIRAGVLYPNKQHQLDARERGQLVSLFTRDLNTAKRHPIVGERPVVLKALRTFGSTRTEIVLGNQSSDRLAKIITSGLLNDAGVIIVL